MAPEPLEAFRGPLDRVLARFPGTTTDAVVRQVLDGEAQLFDAGPGSVIVTQLRDEPTGLICCIWLAAGELAPLLAKHEEVLAWARAQGCDRMRIVGRRGWLRTLPAYKEVGVVMETELKS